MSSSFSFPAKSVRAILARAARLATATANYGVKVPASVRLSPAGLEVIASNRFVIAGDTIPVARPRAGAPARRPSKPHAWHAIDAADLARYLRALPSSRSQFTTWDISLGSASLRIADVRVPVLPRGTYIPTILADFADTLRRTAPTPRALPIRIDPKRLDLVADWIDIGARLDVITLDSGVELAYLSHPDAAGWACMTTLPRFQA